MIDTNIELSPSANAKLDLLQAILVDLATQLCEEQELERVTVNVKILGW